MTEYLLGMTSGAMISLILHSMMCDYFNFKKLKQTMNDNREKWFKLLDDRDYCAYDCQSIKAVSKARNDYFESKDVYDKRWSKS